MTGTRREFLAGIGVAGAAGLTGCSGLFGASGSIGDRNATPLDDGTEAWPTAGFDAGNAAYNGDVALLSEGPESTQLTEGGAGIDSFFGSGVAVAGDRLYYGTGGGQIVCRDVDGEEHWSRTVEDRVGIRSIPTVTRDVVIVSSLDGTAAYDVGDGERLWRSDPRLWRGSPPVTDGLTFARRGDRVAALDVETGDREWQVEVHPISTIAAADGTAYAAGANRSNGAVSAVEDDELLWTRDDLGAIHGRPVTAEDVVLVCTAKGRLYALDREDGDTVWDHRRPESGSTAPAVAHGQVYLPPGNGQRAVCLDLAEGSVEWRLQTGVAHDQPVAVDDGVYFGTPNRGLHAVTPDGSVAWRDERIRTWGSIAAVDGTLYVTPFSGPMGSGDLYAISN